MGTASSPPIASAPGLIASLPAKLRGVLLLTPWLGYVLGADVVLSLLLPLKPVFPNAVYHASSRIAETVWAWVQRIFVRNNRARIVVSSSSALPRGESAVVVANHAAWTDFYLIQEVAQRAGMLGRCRWFAKSSLRWVPFLGWGLWAMGMPLVTRNWVSDQRELKRVFGGIVNHEWPVWLISYSEGTRYTSEKHSSTAGWCAARSKSIPQHTLWPKARGFIATVQALRSTRHVRAVYDFTLAYARGQDFMNAPSFADSVLVSDLTRAGYRMFAHVDRFDVKELPGDDEGLTAWLEERWVKKGERLEELRKALENGEEWTATTTT